MAPETRELKDKGDTGNAGANGAGGTTAGDKDVRVAKADSPRPASGKPGFFTLYKKGQGYWTRIGTAAGAALLIALTAFNLYRFVPIILNLQAPESYQTEVTRLQKALDAAPPAQKVELNRQLVDAQGAQGRAAEAARKRGQMIGVTVAVLFGAGMSLWAWRLMNRPTNADFLIATDSEMKKVNWTSRKDLIGSTKVVIIFMFMIAIFLFVVDIVFGTFFWSINVLRSSPFGSGGTIGGG